ncbi:DUF6460 domain-containing protein [Tepidicaulis sp.]|jgi:hypothetical protein|uniref:DUF6460 domain-containing protein n=1 Tax=Tepidicaulis sp. TaxID=1920809 RepID=UPI003B5B43A6
MDKIFGGPILPTLIKLILASVGVGIVLAIFGIEPWQLWEDFLGTISRVWEMGFNLIDWSFTYFLLGAVIVLPIWLVVRLWSVFVEKEPQRKD